MFIFCIFRKKEDKIKREDVLKNREGDFKKRTEDCTQTRISISNHTFFTPNHHIFAKIELIKFAHCIFNGLSGFMESKCPNFAIS